MSADVIGDEMRRETLTPPPPVGGLNDHQIKSIVAALERGESYATATAPFTWCVGAATLTAWEAYLTALAAAGQFDAAS